MFVRPIDGLPPPSTCSVMKQGGQALVADGGPLPAWWEIVTEEVSVYVLKMGGGVSLSNPAYNQYHPVLLFCNVECVCACVQLPTMTGDQRTGV